MRFIILLIFIQLNVFAESEQSKFSQISFPTVIIHNMTPTIKVGEFMIIKVSVTPYNDPATIFVQYGDQPPEVMQGTIIIKEATQPGLVLITIRARDSKGQYSEIEKTQVTVLQSTTSRSSNSSS